MKLTEQHKEIVLRVANEVSPNYPVRIKGDEDLFEFAARFLAALPKPEPVGVFANVNSLMPNGDERWEHMMDEAYNPDDGYIYLYREAPIAPPASEQKPFGYLCDWGNDSYGLQRVAFYYGEPGSATEDDWNESPKVHRNLALYLAPQPDYKAQRDALLEALKPFSRLLKEHHQRLPDDQPIYGIGDSLITVGDLRRAAIASVKGGA